MAHHILPRTQFLHSDGGTHKIFVRCSQWLDLPPEKSQAMASHIVDSLGLSLTQTQSNFLPHLPKELNSPLVPSNVFESYQHPKCFSLEARGSGNENPDHYICWKHLAKTCTAGPARGFKRINRIVIDDPHWTYQVHLYAMGFYTFTLWNKWTEEETGSESDALLKHSISKKKKLTKLFLQYDWMDSIVASASRLGQLRYRDRSLFSSCVSPEIDCVFKTSFNKLPGQELGLCAVLFTEVYQSHCISSER